MHYCQAPCPHVWCRTRWPPAASRRGLSRGGLGILGIPESAKIIDNALSLTRGAGGIDEWLEGHKSDSCGSTPCHTLTHPDLQLNTHKHTLTQASMYAHKERPLCQTSTSLHNKAPALHTSHTHMHTVSPTLPQQDDSALKMAS